MKDIYPKYIYFIGIGGIGMSAIARFFLKRKVSVAGYDHNESALTKQLSSEGAFIIYEDDTLQVPDAFRFGAKEDIWVVYTPAVPEKANLFQFFKDKGVRILKRAEVLGLISEGMFTLGVAGTHGKTTTSTLLCHVLVHSGYSLTAFLGGISGNYGTNFVDKTDGIELPMADGKSLFVVEADEYDRSFLQLSPAATILTSADADHLDIYGSQTSVHESYRAYLDKVNENGSVVIKKGLEHLSETIAAKSIYTYSITQPADFYASEIRYEGKYQVFSCYFRGGLLGEFQLLMPGRHNVENALAVIALCHTLAIDSETLRQGLASFKGVKRRFEICYEQAGRVLIDDYAHHPEEINAAVTSARSMFPGKKITGVFQPHLYSRTRDFCEGFSQSLDLLDRLLLMEIYPARELPIEGVSSSMIAKNLKHASYAMVNHHDFKDFREEWENTEVLLVMGAGDIERIVPEIIRSAKRSHEA
jgi:UDP-N-acetylmuramate--alanine ligase